MNAPQRRWAACAQSIFGTQTLDGPVAGKWQIGSCHAMDTGCIYGANSLPQIEEIKMVARIYQPTKNPMQSGRGKTGNWVLEYVRETPRKIEPLMGYTSSSDMKQQIKLNFDSKEDAVGYAERNGIAYQLADQKQRKIRITSYSDNFKFDRKQSWTH